MLYSLFCLFLFYVLLSGMAGLLVFKIPLFFYFFIQTFFEYIFVAQFSLYLLQVSCLIVVDQMVVINSQKMSFVFVSFDPQSRIVVAENLPEDHCHQNLMKVFSTVGRYQEHLIIFKLSTLVENYISNNTRMPIGC